ncbi:hypothetical protein MCOR29_000081 [Pyricularia oryzae]|uniref:Uncharacterized protein n=2 Tax=Pyricularia TaxID=48558 RepID=A0ABQ8P0W5_PYRGI|nr:hypothetical protein MCOR26_000279 [Pyricularia oryzae]KAI6304901.1 hypothetical protein MCOR33_000024 [Pyricularia grisea]KAI6336702.1 hypothetical protein MCOR29_000081 [Pyricularia oryzae]KAI6361149.1 hypothetical protein MCOR32_008798 [Pyricularia oryzae]KAI6393623.1 hypothetical protein MCOR23_007906 [Pyricularia oryzae]
MVPPREDEESKTSVEVRIISELKLAPQLIGLDSFDRSPENKPPSSPMRMRVRPSRSNQQRGAGIGDGDPVVESAGVNGV